MNLGLIQKIYFQLLFFFREQTADALINAVSEFKNYKFDYHALLEHSNKWDISSFKTKLINHISNYISKGENI